MRAITKAGWVIAVVATLGIAGCNRSPEPLSDTIEDNVTEIPMDDIAPVNSGDAPAVDNVMLNMTNTVAPPEFSDSEQMRDDADATGLTARLPSEDSPGQTSNETQPAQ